MSYNTTEFDYDYNILIQKSNQNDAYLNEIRMLYIVSYSIIIFLGLTSNLYVIIVSLYMYCKHKNGWIHFTGLWVLALAITHLLFSAFLVPQFLYAWRHFNWHIGAGLCKLSSYVFYASMFSTAALLSLWSLSSGIFRRWRLKTCRPPLVKFMVLVSWTIAAVLSSPSLLSRELRYTELGMQCIDDYDLNKEKMTEDGKKKLNAVILSRIILGLLVPMLLMITVGACVRPQPTSDCTHKRITCMIKVAYFVCWAPLLFMAFLQFTVNAGGNFKYGLPAATVLAAAHCFINPVIYLVMGCKMNMTWMTKVTTNTYQKSNQEENIRL